MGDELLALVKLGVFLAAPNIHSFGYEVPILHVLKAKSDIVAAPVGFFRGKLSAVFAPRSWLQFDQGIVGNLSAALVSPPQRQKQQIILWQIKMGVQSIQRHVLGTETDGKPDKCSLGYFSLVWFVFSFLHHTKTCLQVVSVYSDPRLLPVIAGAMLSHETHVGTQPGLQPPGCGAPCKGHPCLLCPLGFEKRIFRPFMPALLSHGSFAPRLLLVSPLPLARCEVSDSANGLGGSIGFLLPWLGRLPRLRSPAARWGLRCARLVQGSLAQCRQEMGKILLGGSLRPVGPGPGM